MEFGRNQSHWIWLLGCLIFLALASTFFFMRNTLFPHPLTLLPKESFQGQYILNASNHYRVGDLIPLTLVIQSRTGIKYQFPDMSSLSTDKMEIRKKSSLKLQRLPGGVRQSMEYWVTCWQTGSYQIPNLEVSFIDQSGNPVKYQISSIKLPITTTLPKLKNAQALSALDVKGVKKPVGLPLTQLLLWLSLVGILILLLLALFIRTFNQQQRPQVDSITPVPIVIEPAHVIALRRLTGLRQASLLEQKNFLVFYSELSECIREYMENRYEIRALEMTTEEFLAKLTTGTSLLPEHQQMMKRFLQQSDLVKFAKQSPLPQEAMEALEMVEKFVETTKEIEAPDEASGELEENGQQQVI